MGGALTGMTEVMNHQLCRGAKEVDAVGLQREVLQDYLFFFFFSLNFFLKFTYFLLKDHCFTVLCWFLPSINKHCLLLNLKDKYLRDVSLLTDDMENVSLSPPSSPVDLNNATFLAFATHFFR